MARLYIVGWETGTLAEHFFTSSAGSAISVVTEEARTGLYSMKVAAVSGTSNEVSVEPQVTSLWTRFYLKVTSRPATTARVIAQVAGAVSVTLNPNGTLSFVGSTTSVALTDTSKWYLIEIRTTTSTSSLVRLRIDGVDQITSTTSTGGSLTKLGPVDTVADTYTVYFDDFVSDTTTIPGEGRVVTLFPVSDNSVGSGWTKPGGGTTNLYTSIDNTPPVGIADTTNAANAENQIRNASSNSASYVANMTTYTDAGIGAGSTINGVKATAWTGAPTATGAKTGSLQITANPAEGAATAFQSTSAFYRQSGVNAGTFITGWARQINPTVDSPSVTLGNSPTLSLDITGGTASRIAMCCSMFINVDYTPAAADARVPKSSPYPRILAH